jgi:hypothetical protein
MEMTTKTPEKTSAIRKAYIDTINKSLSTLGFIKCMNILSDNLVVLKHRPDLDPEIKEHLRGFARELANKCGDDVTVVLLPFEFDIKSMPREDAVTWLRELARAIDCEVVDMQEPVHPYIFPSLSGDEKAAILEACKNAPPATIGQQQYDSRIEGMREHFRQLGKEKAHKINDIAMKALQE